MIKRSLTRKIDLTMSPFGWRFTDIKWDLLPDAIQRQIYAMPEALSQEIQAQSRQFHHVGWRDFNIKDYQIVAKQSLRSIAK